MQNLEPWKSKSIFAGQQYGRYTVISTHCRVGTYLYFAYCQCECGSPPRYVSTTPLRNGQAASCGCLHKERVTKHGYWSHPLFSVWKGMMDRCYVTKNKRYARYGGRGITVCARWHDIKAFIDDMAKNYRKGLQIDRIDNDKDYSPDNCRWATTGEQTRNYSRNVILEYDGKSLCLADWSAITGIGYQVIWDRVQRGWSAERILTTKAMTSKQSSRIALNTRWNSTK